MDPYLDMILELAGTIDDDGNVVRPAYYGPEREQKFGALQYSGARVRVRLRSEEALRKALPFMSQYRHELMSQALEGGGVLLKTGQRPVTKWGQSVSESIYTKFTRDGVLLDPVQALIALAQHPELLEVTDAVELTEIAKKR